MAEFRGDDARRQLEALLEAPREALGIELKPWLDLSSGADRANLAQAILAIANHGGGYVLLGFTESGGSWVPAEPHSADLKQYSQDAVNGIVRHYADPAFHCETHHVTHPQLDLEFPVIIVPGNHTVPIRAKRGGPNGAHVREGAYYIRRPGPSSEVPQSGREWDELIRRCLRASRENLIDDFRRLLLGEGTQAGQLPAETAADERLSEWSASALERLKQLESESPPPAGDSRYTHGYWTVAYAVIGDVRRGTAGELLETLRSVAGHETGWPPWWVPTRDEIRPRPFDGLVECWLRDGRFGDPAHTDFWRASPEGMLFLLRGYDEDSVPESVAPGTVLSLTIPIWRVGEALLHAGRLATALAGESSQVLFRTVWSGLKGRALTTWPTHRRFLDAGGRSDQDTVAAEILTPTDQVSVSLPELVGQLTDPLYECFDFYQPSSALIQEELAEMKSRGR